MANNADILGEEAAVRQIVKRDFSATNGHFEDDSVTVLRKRAFFNIANLQSVRFPNVLSVGEEAFRDGSNLLSIDLPKATYVGSNAFAFISGGNTKIVLPQLESMGKVAFGRGNLRLVDIGEKVSALSDDAFYQNTAYTEKVVKTLILRKSDAVVTAGSTDTVKGLENVYVPSALVESYKVASNWTYYYNMTDGITFYPLEDYTVDGTTTGEFDESKL